MMLYAITLLTACTIDNDAYGESDGDAIVDVDIDASKLMDLNDVNNLYLGENEYWIKRVRIYAFDGNRLDNMTYYENVATNPQQSVVVPIKVKQTTNKTLYVVINEPASLSGKLALINHPDAFEKMEYEIADYFNSTQAMNWEYSFNGGAFVLPMFGKKGDINTTTATPSTAIKQQIPVTRSLARVDVMVQKEEALKSSVYFDNNSSISIINTKDEGMLAPTPTKPIGPLTNKTDAAKGGIERLDVPVRFSASDKKNAVRAFSFYTPERDCSTSNTKLQFSLLKVNSGSVTSNFTVTVNKNIIDGSELKEITRNMVYRIYCTFMLKEVDVSYKINDWNDVFPIGDVPAGTRFTVSQSRILLNSKYFGGKQETELKLYAVNGSNSYIPITFIEYEYKGIKIPIENPNKQLPTWVSFTNILNTYQGSGTIGIKYTVSSESNKMPVFLWFKAGNIKKRVELIYNHGM